MALKSDAPSSTTLAGEKRTTFSSMVNSELNATTIFNPSTICYNVPCTTQLPTLSSITAIVSILLGNLTLSTDILSSSTGLYSHLNVNSSTGLSSHFTTSPSFTNTQLSTDMSSYNPYLEDNLSMPNTTSYNDQTFSTIDILQSVIPNDEFYYDDSNNLTDTDKDFIEENYLFNFTDKPILFNTTELDINNYTQFEEYITHLFQNTEDKHTMFSEYFNNLFQNTTSSPENLIANLNKISLTSSEIQKLYSFVLNKTTEFTPEYTTTSVPCYVTECRPIEVTPTSTFSSSSTNWPSTSGDNETANSTLVTTGKLIKY